MSITFSYTFCVDMHLYLSLVNTKEEIDEFYGKYMLNFIGNYQTLL